MQFDTEIGLQCACENFHTYECMQTKATNRFYDIL